MDTVIPYAMSLATGLAVGAVYGLLAVKSPAPPVIALIGLLGILVGEMAVSHWRGHPDATAALLHRKSFAVERTPAPGTVPALGDG
jgi:XapX domain-containing protein